MTIGVSADEAGVWQRRQPLADAGRVPALRHEVTEHDIVIGPAAALDVGEHGVEGDGVAVNIGEGSKAHDPLIVAAGPDETPPLTSVRRYPISDHPGKEKSK